MWWYYRFQGCGDISNILVGTKTGCFSQEVQSSSVDTFVNKIAFFFKSSQTSPAFFMDILMFSLPNQVVVVHKPNQRIGTAL